MNRIASLLVVSLSVIIMFTACTSNEIGNIKDVNPESIYFDYRVWGDEESAEMTIRLQYRFAGANGTTLLLEAPCKAELDGVAIKADSSKMSGAYYELSRPVKDFIGKHSIEFTNIDGKKYKEEFNFQPISLRTQLPAAINRGDLIFDVDGLAPRDYLRVMLSDTAIYSEGISRIDTVRNGHVIITKAQMRSLVNGPIQFELSKEDELRVKNGTREGGKLSISYEVKRTFELKDAADPKAK